MVVVGEQVVMRAILRAEPLCLYSHLTRACVVPGCAECLHRISTWHQMIDVIRGDGRAADASHV